jgi:hypothetical protein
MHLQQQACMHHFEWWCFCRSALCLHGAVPKQHSSLLYTIALKPHWALSDLASTSNLDILQAGHATGWQQEVMLQPCTWS